MSRKGAKFEGVEAFETVGEVDGFEAFDEVDGVEAFEGWWWVSLGGPTCGCGA